MLRRLAGSTALALLLSVPALAEEPASEDVTLYRVFVGDHASGRVTAIDLGDPEGRWEFQTRGQAKLHAVGNGAVIAAVQPDDDTVQFIDSGVRLHAHGDHADLSVEDPKAIEEALTGPRPFHLVDHGGKVAINFDRGGYVEIVEGAALGQGEVRTTRLPQARAHHGFVAPIGRRWVTSVASDAPAAEGAAPIRIGLQEITTDGTPVGAVATCSGIHGEAFSGAFLAAGCEEGILTVTSGPQGLSTEMLAYPTDLPFDKTTGTLLGATGLQVFLGNFGASGLLVIDPAEEPHLRHVALPFRRVAFALDPANARFGYVLTEDGSLHELDLVEGSLTKTSRVVEPYSMDGHWNDPRPRIAMAGDEIVLSDPNAGLLRILDKTTLEERRTIEVEGQPFEVAVVGGSGLVHGAGDHPDDHAGHDHGSHDHAGHDHAAGEAHAHGDPQIYAGYFEDGQIADRPLADYEGDWQSVFPYLEDGTLDPVWEQKAQAGGRSAAEIRAEYETGYRTAVERITIEGETVTFQEEGRSTSGQYRYDGYEVLTYKKGNRGVRFIFEKVSGDEDAPRFIQFSDHGIFPAKASHFHLYWGDDRAALLEEITNWPTYYPAALDADAIRREMLAH